MPFERKHFTSFSAVVPNLLGLKSRRYVFCTFLVPCDIKTVINIPIWQLFWSHLDLLQVPVPEFVPVVGNLYFSADWYPHTTMGVVFVLTKVVQLELFLETHVK